MATRLYLHATNTAVTGTLPTTNQSTTTATVTMDAVSTSKRTMNTTIGTSQTSIQAVGAAAFASVGNWWCARFISDPLESGSTSIAANNWDFSYAGKQIINNVTDIMPNSTGGNNAPMKVTCYIWRPSTGAKIGTVMDGNSTNIGKWGSPQNETSCRPAFAGAAVTAAVGDVICVEVWLHQKNGSNTSGQGVVFYFDGTTVTTTSGTAVSNHASYLETPQNLTFSTPSSSIDMTPNVTTLQNKFITKI